MGNVPTSELEGETWRYKDTNPLTMPCVQFEEILKGQYPDWSAFVAWLRKKHHYEDGASVWVVVAQVEHDRVLPELTFSIDEYG